MTNLMLYGITPEKIISIPVPTGISKLNNLYDGFPVGVYSVFRTFDHNKFLWLQNHFDRLDQSMVLLKWKYQLDHVLLRQSLHKICSSIPWSNARVRIDVLKTPMPVNEIRTRLLIGLEKFTETSQSIIHNGVAVEIASGLIRVIPMAKTADFVFQRSAFLAKNPNPTYEYLMIDKNNNILEGTSSNFYGVINNEVWTADSNILRGITREIILSLFSNNNFTIQLQAIPLSDVKLLSEAFLSSSTRGLVPVVQVGRQRIGNGKPGPIYQAILRDYNQFVTKSIKIAVET